MSMMQAQLPTIVDVRKEAKEDENVANIRAQLVNGLGAPAGKKRVPTMLLYDESGLKMYDKITTDATEYYLFASEEEILKSKAAEIVNVLHSGNGATTGEVVIELGAGALRKTAHILTALADDVCTKQAGKEPITYYALDLEKRELDRTLAELEHNLGHVLSNKVKARGMHGTFEDGLEFVRHGGLEALHSTFHYSETPASLINTSGRILSTEAEEEDVSPHSSRSASVTPSSPTTDTSVTSYNMPGDAGLGSPETPLYFMFLGSSLGNFPPDEASKFLRSLPLRPGSEDKLLIGLDHDNDKALIERAYNDSLGITKDFIMNGLKVAGRLLGNESAFDIEAGKWEYVNQYNQDKRRHEAYYRSTCDQTLDFPLVDGGDSFVASFEKNELVHVEYSHKYSDEDTVTLFSEANLRPIHRWTESGGRYSLWLLERPPFDMPSLKQPIVSGTGRFGLPHLDEWEKQWKAWDFVTLQMIPPGLLHVKPIDLRHKCLFYLGHIPTFLDIHLSRFLNEPHTEPDNYKYIFERGIDPNVDDPTQCHAHSKVPEADNEWPLLEEILNFRDRVRERLKTLYKQFENGERELTMRAARVLSMTLEHEQMHAETLLYMLLQVADGSPNGTNPPPGFTTPPWKLLAEKEAKEAATYEPLPATTTLGPAMVTLGHNDIDVEDKKTAFDPQHDFGWDNENPVRKVEVAQFKIEWRPISNGQFYNFYKDMKRKGEVSLPSSWVEIEGDIYVRTLYGPISMEYAYHWPVTASYDDISTYARVQGGRIPTEPELRLFYDTFCYGYLGGMNIGFLNWHPIAATTGGPKNGGCGHNGGVWEWTSTVLGKHEGYSASELYPGYSSDFFDDHHHVVIGGSYATPPRLAQRRTFRNWYQHNYPYAWVGARIAYDI